MSRALSGINLAGVLLLGALSLWQWRANRQANLQVIQLEKVRIEMEGEARDLNRQLLGARNDLEGFREQVRGANESMREARQRAATLDSELQQATAERDQLKANLTGWMEAVAARDAELKRLDASAQKLATERNQAVTEFNQLATKYNEVMNELNARTTQYTALVQKYSAAVKPGSGSGN